MSVLAEGEARRPGPGGPGLRARLARLFARLLPRTRRADRGTIADLLTREIAREGAARSGFFLLPLGLIAGIAAFYGLDLRLEPEVAAGAFLPLAGLALLLRRRVVLRAILTLAASALAGQMLAQAELARTPTTIFSGEATVRIEGRVAWRDVDDRGRFRYLIDIEATSRPVLSRPPDRARILVSSAHAPIPIGGTYSGLVRLRPPSGPAFPGAYDFAFVPFFQGLGAYGFSLGAPEPAAAVDPGDLSFAERVAALRVSMATRIRAAVPGAEGAVASALITGERAGIPDEIDEWLRITGLAHVLSISGFHMALIAGFTMLSVRLAASAVPGLPLLVPTKKIAAFAALLVSTAYLLIAGDNVATQRSWIMLAIMLGAVLLDKPALTLRNVALAAIVVLTLNPHAVVTASFQMSFAATAALVGGYGALMRRWSGGEDARLRRERGLAAGVLVAVAGLALSSLIAGGATTPYGAYHFQRAAPLGGVIANVAAMPLFSFWIMPAALIAVLAMPFGLDGAVLAFMGYGIGIVFAMAERLAFWFPDHATGLLPTLSLVLLSAAILALCFFAGRGRWLAVPFAAAGLAIATPEREPPELLVFEDGKELALIDGDGALAHLKERPNSFVAGQWERAFPAGTSDRADGPATDGGPVAAPGGAGFTCQNDICRAATRSGLRIAWTENYELTGTLCDSAEIAIVSRAIRLAECRSGAQLVTLRTLRRTGSLAVRRDPETGRVRITPSIEETPREWNAHRHAPWPEFWRDPDRDAGSVRPSSATGLGVPPADLAASPSEAAPPRSERRATPTPAGAARPELATPQ